MELLFVTVIAAGIGAIVRYAVPSRGAYGLFLLPALAAAVTAIVWVALVWSGFTFDGGWIWAISLVAGGLAALLTAVLLPRQRKTADARLLTQLSGGKA
jgi:hypothetical protein